MDRLKSVTHLSFNLLFIFVTIVPCVSFRLWRIEGNQCDHGVDRPYCICSLNLLVIYYLHFKLCKKIINHFVYAFILRCFILVLAVRTKLRKFNFKFLGMILALK